MARLKLIRIVTVPISFEKLLEGQLSYMSDKYEMIAVSSDANRLKTYASKEGIRCFPLEMTRRITPFKDLMAIIRLYRFLRKESPAMVHSHTPKAGLVGMIASWLARVPNRWHTVAGLPLMESTGMKRRVLLFIERLIYQCANKIIPNSTGLKTFIIEKKLCKVHKIDFIGRGSSNGIDLEYFDPSGFSKEMIGSIKKELSIPEKHVTFIFVGRLVRDKGLIELVGAFKKLQEYKPDTTLLLVGPLETDLDPLPVRIMDEIESNRSIITTGFRQDVRPYFAVSDALVFPSYREGFPNVILQASAMNLPVIASDINGCNEIIHDEINGLLVPKKSIGKLFEAMKQLVDDPSLRDKLKLNSRVQIQKNYDRKEFWGLLEAKYRKVLING